MTETPPDDPPNGDRSADEVVARFVVLWGEMARSWGINGTMGELFALLYFTGDEWTAEDLRQRLKISRGNVSMNLRELIAWGLVTRVHRPESRREHFRGESDIWVIFRRIVAERKRRELDPTLPLLDDALRRLDDAPDLALLRGRLADLRRFFELVEALAGRFAHSAPHAIRDLADLLADTPTDPRSNES